MNRTISRYLRTTVTFLFLAIFLGCGQQGNEQSERFALGDHITGVGSPITLENDTTNVVLSDYFEERVVFDSIWMNAEELKLIKDGDELSIIGRSEDGITSLKLELEGHTYAIPVKNAAMVAYRYTTNQPMAGRVELAGDFNNWQPQKTPLKKVGEAWEVQLDLYPGNYAYQLVVDGQWMLDPASEEKRSNGMGGFNSILNIPFDDGPERLHNRLSAVSGSRITIETTTNRAYKVYLDNHLLDEGVTNADLLTIDVPSIALGRHHLRFWTAGDGRVSNELRVPLEGNNPVQDYSELNRNDKERNMLYFMMVDRFMNGDSTNDNPLDDARVADRANYNGGDLEGIRSKLKQGYFEGLGINTLWISPITQNPLSAYQEYPEPRRFYSGYHGYWPISYKQVDHRFGTGDVLKQLLDEAHEKDMNVILDFVSNHVHEEHPMIKANPTFKTQLDLEDGSKNIRIWDAQRLTTWFDTFLPSLDFSQEEVVGRVSDSALYWMTNYDFDGFRHDATKHIPESFWRATTKKLKMLSKQTNKTYFQVGETFGDRTLIQSYVGSGMMDGQFDFNVYFDARNVFQDTVVSMEVLAASLQSSLNIHGAQHLMCNITGNHDLPRFISYASGAIGLDEDEKEVGWERVIKVDNAVGYDRLRMLQTFITTIPGIPVIYYGDEIGMPGANDPDNRRMMRFEGLGEEEEAVKSNVRQMINLRKEHLALIYGDLEIVQSSQNSLIYRRQYAEDVVYVCFNNSDKPLSLSIPTETKSNWKTSSPVELIASENGISISLPPYQSTLIHLP